MSDILFIEPKELGLLSPEAAVSGLRHLLWAEALRLGLAINSLNVPSNVTAKDGGIDAEVTGNSDSPGDGLIRPGWNSYQVKAGNHSVNTDSGIKELLFDATGKGKSKTFTLKPRVQECFERAGTFHVVLFGNDDPDPRGDPIIKFRELLVENAPGYESLKINILKANKIASLAERYPAVLAYLTGRELGPARTHRSWSSTVTMNHAFHPSEEVKQQMDSIQLQLCGATEATHIRILGEAGVGKTKLALESLRPDGLAAITLYFENPSNVYSNPIIQELLNPDSPRSALIVVDECSEAEASQLWNRIAYLGSRIHLMTIYNQIEERSGKTVQVETPNLGDEEIAAIFQDYGIESYDASRWVSFCGGSPRVAHMLAQNLKNNPADLLVSPDTEDVWGRYLAGRLPITDPKVELRRLVLQHLALFERFGYEDSVADEARAIQQMAQNTEPELTWPKFIAVIGELKKQKVLQGETTLYITPKALHIKMWAEWWNTYGRSFDYNVFCTHIPSQLLNWFHNMFRFADQSQLAQDTVSRLLDPKGPVQWREIFQQGSSGDFFLALTEANPEGALMVLEQALAGCSKEELRALRAARRTFVYALEKIVVWDEYFQRAARLLLALGAAENETWANNASGVFAALFSLAPGGVAPTEAAPPVRFVVLQEALGSADADQKRLGLRGLSKALNHHFSRMIGAEYQGVRPTPELWKPKTYNEWFDAYRWAWSRTEQLYRESEGEYRTEVFDILLQATHFFLQHPILYVEALDTLERIMPYLLEAERIKLYQRIQFFLRHMNQMIEGETSLARLKEIQTRLIGNDFPSRLRRWIDYTNRWDAFEQEDGEEKMDGVLRSLAQEAHSEPDLLLPHLSWLQESESNQIYPFFYQLALLDPREFWLEILIDHFLRSKSRSTFLLAGYLRGMRQGDENFREELLDLWATRKEMQPYIAEITFRTCLTARAGKRLISLINKNIIPSSDIIIFRYMPEIRNLSEKTFKNWIETILVSENNQAIPAALDMLNVYYLRSKSNFPLPLRLTVKVLKLNLEVIEKQNITMISYEWHEIAKVLDEQHPEATLSLARYILSHLSDEGWQAISHTKIPEVLNLAAQRHPEVVWSLAARALDRRSGGSFYVREWLHGESFSFGQGSEVGAIVLFPPELIWKWVDQKVEDRAWQAARLVPPTFNVLNGQINLVRELLIRYGHREDVQRNLAANFRTGSWTGNASEHFYGEAKALRVVLEGEIEVAVRTWLERYIISLEKDAAIEKINEERHGF